MLGSDTVLVMSNHPACALVKYFTGNLAYLELNSLGFPRSASVLKVAWSIGGEMNPRARQST